MFHKVLIVGILVSMLQLLAVANDCSFPLYEEYIQNFKLNTQDLQKLFKTNLSQISLGDITAGNGVVLNNVSVSVKYEGYKQQQPQTIQTNVSNETISTFARFQAHVGTLNNQMVNVSINAIVFSYTKQLNTDTGAITIASTDFKIGKISINYDKTPNSTTAKKITDAIQSTSAKSFYTSLSGYLKKTEGFMNDNCKDQHISGFFPNGNYQYNFDNVNKINFDMKTKSLTYNPTTKNIRNGLNGIISNQKDKICTSKATEQVEQYNTFISKQFMLNMLSWGGTLYPQFQNVVVDENYRSRGFRFRLIDLEYVLPDVLQKYKQYYMNKVSFTCTLNQIGDLTLKQYNTSSQNLKWGCLGYLALDTPVKIIDFSLNIQHNLIFTASNGQIGVLVNSLDLIEAKFFEVDGMKVTDEDEAAFYITEMFNDCRVYTLGTHFRIRDQTNTLTLTPQGLWLGTSEVSVQ